MRIGIDASCWSNTRGYGRFTRELVREMVARAPDDEFVCIADTATAADMALEAANLRVVRVQLRESPLEGAASGRGSVGMAGFRDFRMTGRVAPPEPSQPLTFCYALSLALPRPAR